MSYSDVRPRGRNYQHQGLMISAMMRRVSRKSGAARGPGSQRESVPLSAQPQPVSRISPSPLIEPRGRELLPRAGRPCAPAPGCRSSRRGTRSHGELESPESRVEESGETGTGRGRDERGDEGNGEKLSGEPCGECSGDEERSAGRRRERMSVLSAPGERCGSDSC